MKSEPSRFNFDWAPDHEKNFENMAPGKRPTDTRGLQTENPKNCFLRYDRVVWGKRRGLWRCVQAPPRARKNFKKILEQTDVFNAQTENVWPVRRPPNSLREEPEIWKHSIEKNQWGQLPKVFAEGKADFHHRFFFPCGFGSVSSRILGIKFMARNWIWNPVSVGIVIPKSFKVKKQSPIINPIVLSLSSHWKESILSKSNMLRGFELSSKASQSADILVKSAKSVSRYIVANIL